MTKLTKEQKEYISSYCATFLCEDETDGKSVDNYWEPSKDIQDKWGWLSVDVKFWYKFTWKQDPCGHDEEQTSTGYLSIKYEWVGIINNQDDKESGNFSIEVDEGECSEMDGDE